MNKIFIEVDNWEFFLFSIISFSFLTLGITNIDSDWSSTNIFIGILIPIIMLSKIYWFKNYVLVMKRFLYVRISYSKGNLIKISNIKKISFQLNKLIITTKDKRVYIFNVEQISKNELSNLKIFFNQKLNFD
ncbi:hypothetical protein FHS04_000849 [Mesoflavibacter sabulilitoris]|uniref:Uncharacterized protein n=1 Tax=Mesoflavibacter zeaxanthinifaciens subsp. sabulilitoris TaxID=1520893 RepID=A0A2T1N5Y6_9FLAO|nr:hypothetical protein [Mesoflavibacter zeaxanthinifaciens]MBB3123352.1 hypothetical protein [Mesoflavibacter zeaxanthinifaciens subsp. sabulilitoris]PSG87015.1 hypothetical protein C7H61_12965 [Mesoflavibacter zeaxanthinifaciens subsp. sabulilitoris]